MIGPVRPSSLLLPPLGYHVKKIKLINDAWYTPPLWVANLMMLHYIELSNIRGKTLIFMAMRGLPIVQGFSRVSQSCSQKVRKQMDGYLLFLWHWKGWWLLIIEKKKGCGGAYTTVTNLWPSSRPEICGIMGDDHGPAAFPWPIKVHAAFSLCRD